MHTVTLLALSAHVVGSIFAAIITGNRGFFGLCLWCAHELVLDLRAHLQPERKGAHYALLGVLTCIVAVFAKLVEVSVFRVYSHCRRGSLFGLVITDPADCSVV